jgi:hypothetical protein
MGPAPSSLTATPRGALLTASADPSADPRQFSPVLPPFWKQKTRLSGALLKRMKGLEPSTFCMARTWRELTASDQS